MLNSKEANRINHLNRLHDTAPKPAHISAACTVQLCITCHAHIKVAGGAKPRFCQDCEVSMLKIFHEDMQVLAYVNKASFLR